MSGKKFQNKKNIITANFPIGHYVFQNIIVLNIENIHSISNVWNQYMNIIPFRNYNFLFSFVGMIQRVKDSIDTQFKIKILSDPSSKGIVSTFLDKNILLDFLEEIKKSKIVKDFKINTKLSKIEISNILLQYLIEIQSKENKKHNEKNIINKVLYDITET